MIRELVENQEKHNFALDDFAQTATYEAEEITNIWNTVINKYHLKLNLYKTEVMMIGRVFDNLNIKIGGYVLTKVISFKQIGSNINLEIWKKIPSAAIIKDVRIVERQTSARNRSHENEQFRWCGHVTIRTYDYVMTLNMTTTGKISRGWIRLR